MNIKVVGVNLPTNVCQICVWLDDASVVWNRKVVRTKRLSVIRKFPDGTQPLGSLHDSPLLGSYLRNYEGLC